MEDDKDRPLILVTNDDGILSPGLRAAVRAAMRLGEVLVAAGSEEATAQFRAFVTRGP